MCHGGGAILTESRRISVLGLGKLGGPLAACFAAKGFEVIGVDTDAAKVRAVNAGRPPVFEPGLTDLFASADGRLRATDDPDVAVASSDVSFLVVPTPSEPDGRFSLDYVLSACDTVGAALSSKAAFHTVVLTSTVMPGSTAGPVRARLEAASGKRCDADFGLCYSPAFIALGSVIRDFLRPDFVLIGESEAEAGATAAAIYRRTCENDPPLVRMSPTNAELAKLAVNAFVTTKIGFANMLARMCERLADADVDAVTAAVGLDSRIGGKYLRGAISYGGPCFPRDTAALAAVARELGAPADIVEATELANRRDIERLARLVEANLDGTGGVAILGLSYKPNTDVVDESPGLLLAQRLSADGVRVATYDPAARDDARNQLHGMNVRLAASIEDCVRDADVIVVTTPWPEFREVDPSVLARPERRRLVVDCWRLLDEHRLRPFVDYLAAGRPEPTRETVRAARRHTRAL